MAQIGKEMQNMSYVSPSKYKDLNICSLQFFKEVFFSGLRLYSIKIGRFGGGRNERKAFKRKPKF